MHVLLASPQDGSVSCSASYKSAGAQPSDKQLLGGSLCCPCILCRPPMHRYRFSIPNLVPQLSLP